ncbi:MAG: alanine--glyoxylate aminotransferase family protein [Fusobacteria bacterium]|nr:alanine--glyoxylate aminotransferase family protein [Fusobacteriota bacterium]
MRNLLMTPGPTPVPEESRLVMAKEIIHHRTKEFSEIIKEVSDGLKYVFKTKNPVLTLTSSGTGAMEAAVVNLFSKGDKVIAVSVGNFGKRFAQLGKTFGLNIIDIEYEWGQSAKVADLMDILDKNSDVKGVLITHHETSTGVLNDIESFGKAIKDKNKDILFVVDAISGLSANEFENDKWLIDCAVSGSQKGFMAPPGLAFVSLSDMAIEACKKSDIPKFYFSFEKALKEYEDNQTPFTPAITTIMSVYESCKLIKKEGIDKTIERHKTMKEAVCEGVKALNLDFFIKNENDRGNTVTTVVVPEGVDGGKIAKIMASKYGITIAGGQGNYKGKIFRIGHLGDLDPLDVVTTFSALELVLSELGYKNFEPGDSLKAIQKYLLNK